MRYRLARANQFDVVGGVSQAEVDVLAPVAPGDRAYVVQTWIVRLMTNRLAAGGLSIPPPLLSRTYQVLSDGTAAAMQARKVSYIAFPFPLRQLLALLLSVFMLVAPMCIAAFMSSLALVGILSFFVCLGYTALNETAAEIESPFGLGANHHSLTVYMRQFNSKLVKLLDLTIPDLGYQPPKDTKPPAGASSHSPPGFRPLTPPRMAPACVGAGVIGSSSEEVGAVPAAAPTCGRSVKIMFDDDTTHSIESPRIGPVCA